LEALLATPTLDRDRRPEGAFVPQHIAEVLDAQGASLAKYSSQLRLAQAIMLRKIVLQPGDAVLILPPKRPRNARIAA
jgi:hypothetical protein